jgi:hypothetical protein
MEEREIKRRVTVTQRELGYLSRILHAFTDYMIKDDRPDHGLAILKGYRKIDPEKRKEILQLSGRLTYLYRNPKNKE